MRADPACPRCDLTLEPDLGRPDAQPRICLLEHGLLAQPAELAVLFEDHERERLQEGIAAGAAGPIRCPVCGGAMRVFSLPAVRGERRRVEIDGCDGCGAVWFDAGEADGVGSEPMGERAWGASPPRREDVARGILFVVGQALRLGLR